MLHSIFLAVNTSPTWLTYASLVIAISSVCVAFFKPVLQARFLGPTLTLGLRNQVGKVYHSNGTKKRYVQLVVSKTGQLSVEGVTVYLEKIAHGDSSFRRIVWDEGRLPLEWQYGKGIKSKIRKIGASQNCDLGHIVETIDGKGEFTLGKQFDTPSLLSIDAKGNRLDRVPTESNGQDMVVWVVAEGDTAASKLVKIHVWYDGTWVDDDDELSRHFKVAVYAE